MKAHRSEHPSSPDRESHENECALQALFAEHAPQMSEAQEQRLLRTAAQIPDAVVQKSLARTLATGATWRSLRAPFIWGGVGVSLAALLFVLKLEPKDTDPSNISQKYLASTEAQTKASEADTLTDDSPAAALQTGNQDIASAEATPGKTKQDQASSMRELEEAWGDDEAWDKEEMEDEGGKALAGLNLDDAGESYNLGILHGIAPDEETSPQVLLAAYNDILQNP